MSKFEMNHHNDGTGLVMSAKGASTDKPYLADTHDVDALLRQMAERVTARFSKVAKGESTPFAAAEQDRKDCQAMAAIFMGNNPDYQAVNGWNGTPLANSIRTAMAGQLDVNVDDHAVIAQAFALFVHELYAAINQHGKDSHFGSLMEAMEGAVSRMTHILMGVQSYE